MNERKYDEKDAVFFQINTIYTYIDLSLFKRVNIDFQEFVYDLDKNLLTNNYKNQTYMKLVKTEEKAVSLLNRDESTISDKLGLVKFFIRSCNQQTIVRRSYQKVPDLLAGISGLLVNMLICIGFVLTLINQFKAKQSIMNGRTHSK